MPDHAYFSSLIWQIADLLRGPYRPPQYERVMLPMTVLRRFDCVLASRKAMVLTEYERLKGGKIRGRALDRRLNRVAGQRFHNRSELDFQKLKSDPDNVDTHLVSYIHGFSRNVREIFEFFEFENEIERMAEANILYLVVLKFAGVNLHPAQVPNEQMGLVFENLIRRFNELANETAGDHFTPREVIRLMVNILFIEDDELLATPGTVRKLLDPACGTGGMLAEAHNYLRDHHREARLFTFGQDYNRRAFATAASDMLMKEVDHNGTVDSVRFGDSLTEDRFEGKTFDYFLTNPPFGVDWKKQRREVKREHDSRGFDGRFGAGLPRVNDGSLLFLLHMWDKREPVRPTEHKHGSRLAIVLSGSPLITGGAGSGESNIRRWIIENDWLEAIIALPEQMFYNTGIGTYIWIVTNRKAEPRRGKIQLIDARDVWTAGGSEDSNRSLGDKRRHLTGSQIEDIVRLYGGYADNETSKIFNNEDFGHTRVTVERPLRLTYRMTLDDKARFLDACPHLLDDVQAIDMELGRDSDNGWDAVWSRISTLLRSRDSKWKAHERRIFRSVFTQKDPDAEPVASTGRAPGYEPDPALRDFETVPLQDDIDAYFEREVRPHVPDAWMDRSKDRIGYEINFNRHFYKYTPPRPLEVVDAELKEAEARIVRLAERRRALITRAVTGGFDPDAPLRDSGVPWLGEIPADWETRRIAWLFRERDERGEPDLPLLAVSINTGVSVRQFSDERIETTAADFNTYKVARQNDVVFNKMRMWQGAVGIAPQDGLVSPDYVVAAPTGALLPQYANLLFRTERFSAECARRSHGIVWDRLRLYWRGFRDIMVPLPSIDAQRAIVNHVAETTAKADALVSAAKDAIALSRERRAALIAAVVTGRVEVEETR